MLNKLCDLCCNLQELRRTTLIESNFVNSKIIALSKSTVAACFD